MSIEIIKVIKEAEEKAEVIKKEATHQAKQIITNANAESTRIIEEAKEFAKSNRSVILKKAEAEGQLVYDDIIDKAAEECIQIKQYADGNMEKAASIILERIVKTSGNS